MKSEAQIRQKLKQVLYRHQSRKVQEAFKKRPETCFFNGAPVAGMPRLCLHGAEEPAKWKGVICDRLHDGVEMASNCPLFEPLADDPDVVIIKAEFQKELRAKRVVLAAKYPDAAALMWVLEEDLVVNALAKDKR